MDQQQVPLSTPTTTPISALLDWFKHFPIKTNITSYTILTPFGLQVLKFLKPILKDFYPGIPIKPLSPDQPIYKNSFKNLLITIVKEKPKFLIDFILKQNSFIENPDLIPSTILHSTLRKILLGFTTKIFESQNYRNFFNSYYLLPPYSINKRFQIAINLARLHLFLQNKYQTIDYKKLFKDLNL